MLIAVATAGVAVFERLRLPSVAAFLVMGALVGPGGLGLIADPERVRTLAELGVVLLLFEIGLELPLDRLRRMWRNAIVAGGLQVAATLACVTGICIAVGLSVGTAIVVGALVAMSSTALVIRLLAERGQLEAPQGQIALGVLIFQDLSIVVFLLAVPILAGEAMGSRQLALEIARAVLALVAFFVIARFALPPFLERVAQVRSREVFTMVGFLIVVGSAVIAETIGLTLSVGAFVGGLVLSASPYAHQLFAEVVPLRGLLLGVFFTAVGMLFDPEAAAAQWPGILAYAGGVIFLKAGFVVAIVGFAMRQGLRLGILTGFALAQTGEFSFVLAVEAGNAGLLDPALQQIFVAGSIATLVATPFLIEASPRVAAWLTGQGAGGGDPDEAAAAGRADHVAIVGFGFAGQSIARVLRARGLDYAAVEANAGSVRRCLERGEPVVYGDATRRALLERLGVPRARLVIIAISAPLATREIVTLVRAMAPDVPILARTRYVREVDDIARAGATQVVAEEIESTLELLSQTLQRSGVPEDSIARFTSELRDEGYVFMRTAEEILDPWLAELLEGFATHWVDVSSSLAGESTLESLAIRARTGATVVAVERRGATEANPPPSYVLHRGDRILAIGTPDAIERLRELLG